MELTELNKCLRMFYVSARKQDGSYYNKKSLTCIRAAIERHLRKDHKKPFSIIGSPEFNESNETLNSFLKSLSKSGEILPSRHKPALTKEAIEKLFEAGELVDRNTMDPAKLQQTTWFFISLFFGRRGRENQRALRPTAFKLCKTPMGVEYFKINRDEPGGVLTTKNHQGGLNGSEDPSDGVMIETKGLRCPVAILKKFLSHLNPECQALFQKPLTGSKFVAMKSEIWYSAVPLGHNTLDSMMKNMCLRAGISTPFTNHSVRATTVSVLSAADSENRHIRAVTGHKSDSSLTSYNERPSFEQFCAMSTALNEFIDSNSQQVAPSNSSSLVCHQQSSKASQPQMQQSPLTLCASASSSVQENICQVESQSFTPGFIAGGSFVNCTFNFNINHP